MGSDRASSWPLPPGPATGPPPGDRPPPRGKACPRPPSAEFSIALRRSSLPPFIQFTKQAGGLFGRYLASFQCIQNLGTLLRHFFVALGLDRHAALDPGRKPAQSLLDTGANALGQVFLEAGFPVPAGARWAAA